MMIPKTLSTIADLVVDVTAPSRRHALTPEELDAEINEVRQRAARRAEILDRLRKRRAAWSQLSEEELDDLVVARLRRRARAQRSQQGAKSGRVAS